MALITRITRLFRTDMHAVLDRLEEPELMLKQSLREMEEAIDAEHKQLQLLEHDRKHLGKRATAMSATLETLEQEISVCLDADNDDLARKLLRRKLQTTALIMQLKDQQACLGERLDSAREVLALHEERFESMQQKMHILSADPNIINDPAENFAGVTDADVEVALLQEKQRRAS